MTGAFSFWRQLYECIDRALATGQHPRPDANSACCDDYGEEDHETTLSLLAIGVCANALMSLSALAQATPEVTLTRLDCGTSNPPTDVGLRFSDTYAYNGVKVQLVFSCYLIKHGDDYMVWDSGHSMSAGAVAPKTSLV